MGYTSAHITKPWRDFAEKRIPTEPSNPKLLPKKINLGAMGWKRFAMSFFFIIPKIFLSTVKAKWEIMVVSHVIDYGSLQRSLQTSQKSRQFPKIHFLHKPRPMTNFRECGDQKSHYFLILIWKIARDGKDPLSFAGGLPDESLCKNASIYTITRRIRTIYDLWCFIFCACTTFLEKFTSISGVAYT